jgi:autotransporter-associated beta strand protein
VLTAAGHNSAPEAEIEGGLLPATNAVIVGEAAGAVGTVKLYGGTLAAPSVTRGGGQADLLFDGGAFRPTAEGQTLQGLTSAQVGAGGAWFDLSSATNFTLAQVLTTGGADGGRTKTGAGKLTVSGKQCYAGPTTVSAGTLRIPVGGSLSNVTALTVAPGAELELDSANTQTVSVASLTLGQASSAPASVTLAFLADGTANDQLAVSGPASLGVVAFKLVRVALNDAFGLNGTYTLATYTGSDPSTNGLSVANPAYGKTYTFAAASGALTVTVATDYSGAAGGAIWNATTGGSWFDSGNWVVAPGAGGAGQTVRFDDKIAAPSTVALGSAATVGQVIFSSANAYTLAGASQLSLDNGSGTQALVSVEAGSHTVSAPVQVSAEGAVVQAAAGAGLTLGGSVSGSGPLIKTAGGTLTAAAASARTGVTELQGGELVLKDGGTVGSGALVLNGGAGLRAAGSAPAALGNP